MLTADELLAGGELTFDIDIPPLILDPAGASSSGITASGINSSVVPGKVKLRPLTVKVLQRISRAAKQSDNLTATLMVQASLVEPPMTVIQVGAMHVGLVEYLLHQVNKISGISTNEDALNNAAEDPLAKAAFILAKEFGWTPQDINDLTLGQVVLHLQMLKNKQTQTNLA
ncbi:MAG: hypothetical protein KUG79_13860 [Pseudomonadales bacterium]|nr:hypothetical protein [Pseudomonadales bacterium]